MTSQDNARRWADMGTLLEELLALEKARRRIWERELAELPEGSLYCLFTSGKNYFYHAVGGERRNISNDLDLIYRLARKKYVKLQIAEQQKSFRRIGSRLGLKKQPSSDRISLRSPLEELIDNFGRRGLDALRITCSEERYLWTRARYLQNPFDPHKRKYETYSGIKMRSKSERDIGNNLEIRGIPYRYEQGINLPVDWMEGVVGSDAFGEKMYYPDFVILTATGEIIIWEHLGRADLKRYREHNMEKIAAYRQSGEFDDAHIILTFEKDLESPGMLDRLIERRIMPYM